MSEYFENLSLRQIPSTCFVFNKWKRSAKYLSSYSECYSDTRFRFKIGETTERSAWNDGLGRTTALRWKRKVNDEAR